MIDGMPVDLVGPEPRKTRLRPWLRQLRGNEALMKIAANTGWLLGERVVRAALGFVVGAWVARYLGPDRFGHFAYVLAFIAFFQAVANLGADSIVVRDVARDPESAPEVLGSILRLRLISGLVCWAAAVGGMALVAPSDRETIAMTAIIGGVLIFQAADTVDLWFQSRSQSRRTVKAKLLAYLLTNGLKIVLIVAKAPLIAFAGAFLLDFAAAAIALSLAYRGYPTAARWSVDRNRAKGLLRNAWPFLLSGLSISLYLRTDQIMLKSMRGDHEVGIFTAAMPLSQIWQIIPLALATSFGPFITRKKLQGEAEYDDALLKVFRVFMAISLAGAAATCLFAPLLVPLIYGLRYTETVGVLQIHVFTNIFIALGVAQGLWIANEQAGRHLLLQTLAGAVIAVGGNWLVIPTSGAVGAAWVAVLANATSALLVNFFLAPRLFRMQLGFRPPPRS